MSFTILIVGALDTKGVETLFLKEQIEQRGNGKSIMGIMMLAASRGTILTISTEGSDENAAHDALRTLIEDRFEEGE